MRMFLATKEKQPAVSAGRCEGHEDDILHGELQGEREEQPVSQQAGRGRRL